MRPHELAAWRKARRLTQAEVADRLGLSLRTWSRYETGAQKAPALMRKMLQEFFRDDDTTEVINHLRRFPSAPRTWPASLSGQVIGTEVIYQVAKVEGGVYWLKSNAFDGFHLVSFFNGKTVFLGPKKPLDEPPSGIYKHYNTVADTSLR